MRLISLALLVLALAFAAEASSFCQCTTYVANRFHLNWGVSCPTCRYAKQLGPGLVKTYHWRAVSTPSVGDIVIFQPGTYPLYIKGGSGSSSTGVTGHIGVVSAVSGSVFAVTGANQGCTSSSNAVATHCVVTAGCTNVNTIHWYYKHTGITFYAPPLKGDVEVRYRPSLPPDTSLIRPSIEEAPVSSENLLVSEDSASLVTVTQEVTPTWVVPVVVVVSVLAAVAIVAVIALLVVLRRRHVAATQNAPAVPYTAMPEN